MKEIMQLRAGGKSREAEMAEANRSAMMNDARAAQAGQSAQLSRRMEETMTAFELANRQDRVNAALRDAIKAYAKASAVALGDYADNALLRMAEIYEAKLKDPKKAMEVYDRIVRTFPGTAVAENAVWRRAQYFVREGQFEKAEEEYKTFVGNYPNSTRVEEAIFRLAEVYEQQNKWVEAMDTYRNYINRFPKGPKVQQAKDRIVWIKTYRLYE
jgi:TolA-binding protein